MESEIWFISIGTQSTRLSYSNKIDITNRDIKFQSVHYGTPKNI